MEQPGNRPLGLHCLLYLVADRICAPETAHPDGSVADALSKSEHRLARVVGSAIKTSMSNPPTAPNNLVLVPCRPTLAVPKPELASKLLMAALLECRDLGRVELRLVEPPDSWWNRMRRRSGRRVRVKSLPGPPVDGLCGQILDRLQRKEEQGAEQLLSWVTGNRQISPIRVGQQGMHWVIPRVESELADHGYMTSMVVRHWLAGDKVRTVVDCERIQTLAEDCALAVDRWNQAWAANIPLCDALLTDCAESMRERGGGA
jgi:hypothetical protein